MEVIIKNYNNMYNYYNNYIFVSVIFGSDDDGSDADKVSHE